MQFRAHGNFDFQLEGRILRLSIAGSLNQEGLAAYREEAAHYFAALAGAPWGVLAVVSEGGFLLDGTRDAMIESIRRQQQNGRCATAAVLLETVEGRSIFEERLRRMYSEAGQNFAIFTAEASARAWLIERIDEANAKGT